MHYIYAGDGLAAIYVKNGTSDTMYYVHKDYLGSMDALTNDKNTVVQYMSFDECSVKHGFCEARAKTDVERIPMRSRHREGRRRNPTNWTFTSVPSNYVTDRGYTGHEHMDKFGLINMNGRVYNPVLGRFHNPDPVVTGAGGTQSWNRYSYVLNNPLKYTDPSGYVPKQEWDMERNMRVSRKMEIAGLVNSGSLHNAAAMAQTYQNLPFFGFNNSIFANSTTLGSFTPNWDVVNISGKNIAAALQKLNSSITQISYTVTGDFTVYGHTKDESVSFEIDYVDATLVLNIGSDISCFGSAAGGGGSDFLDKAANIGDWANIALIAPSLGTDPRFKVPAKAQAPGYNLANEIKVNNAMNTASKYIDGAGKALGIVSYLDHTNKALESMQNGHVLEGLGYYGLSIIDVAIWFNKSTNPYVLGSIFVYDIVDATAF